MRAVFLSASVPLPDRHEKYYSTADVVAIRDSVKALVSVFIPHGKIVFGGHPAITPLVRRLTNEMKQPARQRIVLYQSRFFSSEFPPEVDEFETVRLTPKLADRDSSLLRMREEMIRSEPFEAGIFIGGMEGVEEEYAMFRKTHEGRPAYPIASTGAAADILFREHCPGRKELKQQLAYPSLFRHLLNLS